MLSFLANWAHIPGQAISDLGAKAGSEGLKRRDCSPCTTRLFSASYAARHFQTVPHSSQLNSLTDGVSQRVHGLMDIVFHETCVTVWSACLEFCCSFLFWEGCNKGKVSLCTASSGKFFVFFFMYIYHPTCTEICLYSVWVCTVEIFLTLSTCSIWSYANYP